MDYRPSPPLPSSIARWLAILLVFCGVIPALAAEGRVALIIGNAAYTQKPLKNPVNDAEDLADTLKGLGFEVLLRKNRSEEQMKQDLVDFQDRLERNKGVGLFYFSGHGMQAGRGRNYLLPVGREYKRERDVETFGVDAGMVLARMEEAGSTLNIVILDACRDSPLPAESRSAGSRGLGRMEAPSGSLIAFSTAPGSVADDNAAGRNGLYTKHLITALRATDLRLEDVFKQVGREVERESGRRQSPEEVSKLRDVKPFYFNLRGGMPPPPSESRPGTVSFDLGDLEDQRKARSNWAEWQKKMQLDFDRVLNFKDEAELQVKAWERFLAGYAANNPFSDDDERLRADAQNRKTALESALQNKVRGKPNGVLAYVNGRPILKVSSEAMLNEQVASGKPNTEELTKAIREELIRREALIIEANKKGFGELPDFTRVQNTVDAQRYLADGAVLMRAYLLDYVKAHPVTDAEVKAEYDKIKSQIGDKEYKARHILVDNEEAAQAIIAKLDRGEKFDELAKQSKDPGSKEKGGDLGWANPASFVNPFSAALVKLEKSRYTATPVKTVFGYHVIKLEDSRPLKAPAFDEVRPQLKQRLEQQSVERHIAVLRSNVSVR